MGYPKGIPPSPRGGGGGSKKDANLVLVQDRRLLYLYSEIRWSLKAWLIPDLMNTQFTNKTIKDNFITKSNDHIRMPDIMKEITKIRLS